MARRVWRQVPNPLDDHYELRCMWRDPFDGSPKEFRNKVSVSGTEPHERDGRGKEHSLGVSVAFAPWLRARDDIHVAMPGR